MTRSYNCRRGKIHRPKLCWCGGCSNRRSLSKLRKKEKQKLLKFWGRLYQHKRRQKQHDDYIGLEYKYENGEIVKRFWVRYPYKRTSRKVVIVNDDTIEKTRKDYRETLGGWV